MKTQTYKYAALGASLALLAGVVQTSHAADPVKLRVADSFPAGHYIPKALTQPFMDEVKRLSNNAVEFEYYPAEQLGKAKDMLSLAQSGVADITYVAPAFVSDKMPLSAVAELPGSFSHACEGTKAYWKLVKTGGILEQKELTPLGVHVLFTLVLPPYQLFLGKGKIDGLKSLEGLKIRTSGGAKDIAVRKLKAVSIQMATPEVREALSRGTIDGMLFPYSSILSYDLQGLVKYSTVGENFGSFIVNYVISEKKWKALSPEVQKAMTEAGEAVMAKACQISQDGEAADTKTIEKAGDTLVTLSPEDKKTVAELMSSVGTEWAAALDKRGKPGTEVLNAYKEALK
ncbi:TRAP transporter substrate-binding protein DctP [Alcaligenaceae bacterium]|nr:TRAP transporter substrate-binding protein DctP [Alcaligenaceae bacterium]